MGAVRTGVGFEFGFRGLWKRIVKEGELGAGYEAGLRLVSDTQTSLYDTASDVLYLEG